MKKLKDIQRMSSIDAMIQKKKKKAMGEKEEKKLNGGWGESQNLGERCNVAATRVVERV